MWTTVTETLVCLCSFVVICPFVRAPLPNRDDKSSVATIETILDCVNIALCGIQRNMRTQPSRDAMLDMQRDTCCVEECGTYETFVYWRKRRTIRNNNASFAGITIISH